MEIIKWIKHERRTRGGAGVARRKSMHKLALYIYIYICSGVFNGELKVLFVEN